MLGLASDDSCQWSARSSSEGIFKGSCYPNIVCQSVVVNTDDICRKVKLEHRGDIVPISLTPVTEKEPV